MEIRELEKNEFAFQIAMDAICGLLEDNGYTSLKKGIFSILRKKNLEFVLALATLPNRPRLMVETWILKDGVEIKPGGKKSIFYIREIDSLMQMVKVEMRRARRTRDIKELVGISKEVANGNPKV